MNSLLDLPVGGGVVLLEREVDPLVIGVGPLEGVVLLEKEVGLLVIEVVPLEGVVPLRARERRGSKIHLMYVVEPLYNGHFSYTEVSFIERIFYTIRVHWVLSIKWKCLLEFSL